MDIHKNARLTLHSRAALVQRVQQGTTLKLAAASFNVSRKTAAKWVGRHYENSHERDLQLQPWLDHYNFARPHGSLGYAPPISRAPVGTTS